jgi:hypothetical protein
LGGVPQNANPGVLDARHQVRGDQVGRRHHAVAGVVMLVDDDGIEPEPVGEFQFRQILLVKQECLFRIVELVRKIDPKGFVFLVVGWKVNIGHEVHDIESDVFRHIVLPERFPHCASTGIVPQTSRGPDAGGIPVAAPSS